ncbi:hypothetical protein [Vibrio sp. Hal054]|uniref:hypothetical protein n=1 Tax=Vibrio sp. Hal054 TaxID=3035158 RepID=UPI00301DC80E
MSVINHTMNANEQAFLSKHPYLSILRGEQMQAVFVTLQIEDEEHVTDFVIQNVDVHSPNFGNCVLFDKSGTINYYVPEIAEGIVPATLLECCQRISDNADTVVADLWPNAHRKVN